MNKECPRCTTEIGKESVMCGLCYISITEINPKEYPKYKHYFKDQKGE